MILGWLTDFCSLFFTANEEQLKTIGVMVTKFLEYSPDFKGPKTPEQSITALRSVIENASIEKGNGGDFLSHYGNKQWL